MPEEFDKGYWEERWNQVYRDHADMAHRMGPNPQLVTEAGDLAPGTALDAGCGRGAEATWLASRGWQVTAVDISATALRRAREHAESLGADITNRIDWVAADLTTWTPNGEHFDLVTTHYVHTMTSRESLLHQLAAAVAPGGTLLVVGHYPSDQPAHDGHASPRPASFTAEDVTASLNRDRWDIAVAEARTRTATGPNGGEVTMHDSVLRARKRP
ncbi:MAG: class I SAM-dependent methyltransferase [Nocardioidaceae bacterium]